MGTLLAWLAVHGNKLVKAICGLSIALLLSWGITLHNANKKLSESLEIAQNNIEAYQGSLQGSQQANNVLKLDISELQAQNDKILHDLDSVRKKLNIKASHVHTAATQKQVLNVNGGKGVKSDLVEVLKDTIYQDSIKYNDLTTVYYTIGRDTVSISMDISNTQYIYLQTKRVYKNKKSFIKRLFTFDFKKVNKYTYEIENTNDLFKTTDVRIVEAK